MAKKYKMNGFDWLVFSLIMLGAISWGLVGVSQMNLIDTIFGGVGLTQTVYILIGLAGLYKIWKFLNMKK